MNQTEFEGKTIQEQISTILTYHQQQSTETENLFEWFCKKNVKNHRDNGVLDNNNHHHFGDNGSGLSWSSLIDRNFLLALEKIVDKTKESMFLDYLQLLHTLCLTEGCEEMVSDVSLNTLFEALKNNLSDPYITSHVSIIFGLLSTHETVRSLLKPAIPLLIHLFDHALHDQQQFKNKVLMAACRALNNICYRSVANKKVFVSEEGFQKIISLFGEGEISDDVKCSAALLLRNICCMATSRSFLLNKHDTLLLDILCVWQLVQEIEPIQQHMLWATLNIIQSWPYAKHELGDKGGCTQVLEIMRKFSTNITIQVLSTKVIILLSTENTNRVTFGKHGAVFDIISNAINYSSNKEIFESSLTCLSKLCTNSINRKRLISVPQLLTQLKKIIQSNISERNNILLSLQFITQLAHGANDCRKLLKELETVNLLTDVIAQYVGDTVISQLAHNSMAEVYKTTHQEEETSDEEISDDEQEWDNDDDLEPPTHHDNHSSPNSDGNGSDDNTDDEDVDEDRFALASFRDAQNQILRDNTVELELKNQNMQQSKQIEDLQAELGQELRQRTRLENEIKELRTKLKDNGERVTHSLQLESQNQQLMQDLQSANEQISGYILQSDRLRNKLSLIEGQHQEEKKMMKEIEIKQQQKEVEGYKKIILDKDQEISYLRSMLFNYLTLSIKLTHGPNAPNFDKEELLEKLNSQSVPVEKWPRLIQDEIQKYININSSTTTTNSSSRITTTNTSTTLNKSTKQSTISTSSTSSSSTTNKKSNSNGKKN
eukprot:TRINITY_DN11161_c0_g1_i1.p1 TRINITY_DN11161_c0_g1~~TRINITY_DN11161_c0_g1_i1.p1  ORF type:complete len:773 (-),score=238.24 TRINITY_DN11161_c0_g1_i1:106-2424(-)